MKLVIDDQGRKKYELVSIENSPVSSKKELNIHVNSKPKENTYKDRVQVFTRRGTGM